MESIRSPKEYLEDVLGNMTLKGIPFSILQAATEDVDFLEQTLSQLDEQFLDMNNMTDLPKSGIGIRYRNFIRNIAFRGHTFYK